MNANELKEVLELHKKWLNGDKDGKRANLCNADLRDANLCNANLRRADLRGADLGGANLRRANLCNANLYNANLRRADLGGANLYDANLCNANLRHAVLCSTDLRRADLGGANLKGADLDFSCLPLWCFSLTAQMDDRQVIQLLYHTLSIAQNSKNVSEKMKSVLLTKTNLEIANRFHRVRECGVLKGVKE